jgi:DNA-binding transcriptional MerR regulator
MNEQRRTLRSGQLAREVGISTDTLRHYERLGILRDVPRTSSGYRIYPRDCIDRVKMVRQALQIGFTLPELAQVLRLRDSGGTPCKRVLAMLEEKLETIQRRIKELEQTRQYMESVAGKWRTRVAQVEVGKEALLLHSLKDAGRTSSPIQPQLRRKQKR